MKNNIIISIVVLIVAISGIYLTSSRSNDSATAPAPAPAEISATVALATKASLGNVLVNKKGMTLYYFTKDVTGDSVCAGECLEKWPVFYESNIRVEKGLNKSDFGSITRADGGKQSTYKGWPLYYFVGDKAAADTNGEGVKNVWFVAKPDYDLMVANNGTMNYLVDETGNSLYYFTKDTKDKSNCDSACLEKWPVLASTKPVAPSTIQDRFGSIAGELTGTQSTFDGMPLYYFVGDKARGEMNGQGVKEVWYVVDPLVVTQ